MKRKIVRRAIRKQNKFIRRYFHKFEYLVAFFQSQITNKQFIYLSSVLVGITAALAVILLKTFAHSVFTFANFINGIVKLSFINSILPIFGILLTVFVVKRLLGGKIEKGASQILHAVARKASIIPRKQMYAQIITSSLTVGLGGSAGLESPIVITGAAFGSNYARRYNLSYKDRTLLIGCGVAAGIAAAFNAPIAGVLFAIEVLLVDVSISAFTPIMIAAATGALVSEIALNESILLSFKQKQVFDYHFILYYVFLGLFTGIISVFYARNFRRIEHFLAELKWGPYKKALIGACVLAVIIFLFPSLFGEGYDSIKTLSDKNPGKLMKNTLFSGFRNNQWALLLFVGFTMTLKVLATGITLGSGGNGGNFAPSLFLGSYVGFFFSKLINLSGLTKLPITNFTLVGMAGILSGLFHAPLTAIFLIAEITGGYDLMIPLMIVASISFAVSKHYESYSMDVKNLVEKGHVFTNNKDKNILSTLNINSIIKRDLLTVSPNVKLKKISEIIAKSDQIVFPVVNRDNDLLGVVYFKDVRKIIFNPAKTKSISVKNFMTQPVDFVSPFESMESVMTKFEKSEVSFLPVIKEGKYIGFISRANALNAYRSKLKSMSIE